MLFSKSCHLVLFVASLLSANAVDTVNLGTAENYAILTKDGISTVPTSVITGDIAVSPAGADAITGFSLTLDSAGGFSTSDQVTGTHKAYGASYTVPTPSVLTTAIFDMEAAYTDAESRDVGELNLGAGDISELTLTPGVYTFDTGVSVSKAVTFNGTNSPETDIFIIQMTGGLTVAAGTSVT